MEFQIWKDQYPDVNFELVKENHDRLPNSIYETMNISVYKNYKEIAPFRFVHDAEDCKDDVFCISGHAHPGVTIKSRGKQHFKPPCYQVTNDQLVLPAFSEFTGLNTLEIEGDMFSYAFTETSFIKICYI